MSLGSTKAWAICTKRAGVWIFRLTLVYFTVASGKMLSPSAMFELFLTFDILVMSVVLGFLPRKCKVHVIILSQTADNPFSAGNGGGLRMRRYIRCELFGQIYSMGLMLWSSGQILTNFNSVRPCLCRGLFAVNLALFLSEYWVIALGLGLHGKSHIQLVNLYPWFID